MLMMPPRLRLHADMAIAYLRLRALMPPLRRYAITPRALRRHERHYCR